MKKLEKPPSKLLTIVAVVGYVSILPLLAIAKIKNKITHALYDMSEMPENNEGLEDPNLL